MLALRHLITQKRTVKEQQGIHTKMIVSQRCLMGFSCKYICHGYPLLRLKTQGILKQHEQSRNNHKLIHGVLTDKQNDFQQLSSQALSETGAILQQVKENEIYQFMEMVRSANRIACYGVGREGLCMKALAMRLFRMGLKCSVVGEMTATHIGSGDLLLVSAGPGYFSTVEALANTAKAAGAQVVLFTSKQGLKSDYADLQVVVPAKTMQSQKNVKVDVKDVSNSVLPMGSAYELALWITFDIFCLMLQKELNLNLQDMSSRHTNME
eukprot:TRINITY_DN1302_c2_g1_i2.p1 TRINITY_DN1302_c2_g1~~TRINITY_DN1302_c2_g1_i2.p1  ORF type:complete len:267 (-),score=14.87 TRINITY_DN1302_c2_g1_i2:413-1213(-)